MATRQQRRKGQSPFASRWSNPIYSHMFSGKQPVLQQDVESKPSPASTKGWDAISPISAMEPDYAVILDNAVPRPTWVEIRGGSSTWCSGLGGEVETLMIFRPADAVEEMFAVAEGDLYDVSTLGSPTVVDTGFTSSRWQYINFTPSNGVTHLLSVNGSDDGQIYDGSTWEDMNITGVNTSDLINISVHKRRIWFIEKNSTNAWYLATDAISGAATKFELGSLFSKGGNLIAMGVWTVDGGNGPDDFAVFISSKGQVIIFKGTDPNNANAWFHVGTFNLPPPLGVRCFWSYGSDLLLASLEGLLPISKALPFDPSGVRSVALTNRIQNAMLSAAQNGRIMFGWEVKTFPLQSLLVMNVPIVESSTQYQYVMNTLTGAWCRFTGWNANCFELYNESLFFGDNSGNVKLAYSGRSDDSEPIVMDMKTAFNYYDDPGRIKIVQMCKPYMVTGGEIIPTISIDVDFGEIDFNAPIAIYQELSTVWDDPDSIWDTSLWASQGLAHLSNDWQTVGAVGTAISLRIKLNVAPSSILSLFDTGLFDEAVFDGGSTFTASGQSLPIIRINSFQVILEHGAPVG